MRCAVFTDRFHWERENRGREHSSVRVDSSGIAFSLLANRYAGNFLTRLARLQAWKGLLVGEYFHLCGFTWWFIETEQSRSCTPQSLVRPWSNYQIMNLPHKSKFSWDDIDISGSLFSFVYLHKISSGKTVLNCVKE